MSDTRQHHEATLTPKPESVEATRELLLQCARQVEARQGESWPTTWCASYDEGRKVFVVEALFPDAAAVAFHQANIGPILKAFGPLLGAPPQTVIRPIFVTASRAGAARARGAPS